MVRCINCEHNSSPIVPFSFQYGFICLVAGVGRSCPGQFILPGKKKIHVILLILCIIFYEFRSSISRKGRSNIGFFRLRGKTVCPGQFILPLTPGYHREIILLILLVLNYLSVKMYQSKT